MEFNRLIIHWDEALKQIVIYYEITMEISFELVSSRLRVFICSALLAIKASLLMNSDVRSPSRHIKL